MYISAPVRFLSTDFVLSYTAGIVWRMQRGLDLERGSGGTAAAAALFHGKNLGLVESCIRVFISTAGTLCLQHPVTRVSGGSEYF